MAESKIPELLAKLEKLDPETWHKLEEIRTAIRDAEEGWKLDGVEYYFGADIFPMVIQGAIRDAIAARSDWSWKQEYLSTLKETLAIVTIHNECWTDDKFHASRGTPAEALLDVYVAALEAEAENAN